MDTQEITVLLVEDDDIAAESVERGFRRARIANPIVRVVDGIEALQALRSEAGAPTIRQPFVILLDLNLPRMGGLELLKELRKDPELCDCVVFVLTTSKADEDRTAAYRQHVAGYVVKAKAGPAFMDLVTMLDAYWKVVSLPTKAGRATA